MRAVCLFVSCVVCLCCLCWLVGWLVCGWGFLAVFVVLLVVGLVLGGWGGGVGGLVSLCVLSLVSVLCCPLLLPLLCAGVRNFLVGMPTSWAGLSPLAPPSYLRCGPT